MLEMRNISKYYKCNDIQECVISNINLIVRSGEILALVGPSGSGKSTILQIAGLLDEPSTGDVLFNDVNCSKLNDRERTKIRGQNIGFVYQYHHLLSDFSVMHNIILPRLVLRQSKKQARLDAEIIIEQLNIQNTLGKEIANLSGGERQRIAIARALINSPKLILADEPTGSLDHKNSLEVFSLFLEMAKNRGGAVIIVTHDKNLAQKADTILDIER